jgi:hypothetical protein
LSTRDDAEATSQELDNVGYLSVSDKSVAASHRPRIQVSFFNHSSAFTFSLATTTSTMGPILAFIAILGLYLVGNAVYYVTLHPLANIPGPKICGITRIPYWLASLKGEDVKWMKRLHDRYGPVVRFGPTDVSYTASEAWIDIHGPKVTEKAQEFSVQPVNGEN